MTDRITVMEKIAAFIALMRSGGPVNGVILALYALTLARFSERLVWFFRTRRGHSRFSPLPEGDSLAAFLENRAAREKRSPLYRMALVFADNAEKTEQELSERIDREGALIKRDLERGGGFFSFAGTAAPLLGLLGTITGLMNAFSQIEERGSAADITFLAGGIREAMITTATGLVTAICALGAGKLFEHLAASRLADLSAAVSLLGQQFCRRKAGPAAESAQARPGDPAGAIPARERA
jgi:biopolymer transport protein ExbB